MFKVQSSRGLLHGSCSHYANTSTCNFLCNLCFSSPNYNSSYTFFRSSLLTILYFNAWSLIPKMDELNLLATMHSHDVIWNVETWLEEDINDSQRLDTHKHGRGILLYIKDRFNYSTLLKPTGALELVSVVVQHDAIPTRTCVYCPPISVLDDLYT